MWLPLCSRGISLRSSPHERDIQNHRNDPPPRRERIHSPGENCAKSGRANQSRPGGFRYKLFKLQPGNTVRARDHRFAPKVRPGVMSPMEPRGFKISYAPQKSSRPRAGEGPGNCHPLVCQVGDAQQAAREDERREISRNVKTRCNC
jgi:hypothetical protein